MKFTLSKARLSGYLQSVLQVVPTKSPLPILSNVLFEALEDKLKISATDLEVSITATFDCAVAKKGATVLPARYISDILKELPESEIVFEGTPSKVEMKIPNGSYRIACVSHEDFPKLPTVNTKKQINIDSADLVMMIKKTTFACSTDETRPALNGVLWSTKGDMMTMVATDGHRLARMVVENKMLKGLSEDIIIPPKVLRVVSNLLNKRKPKAKKGNLFGQVDNHAVKIIVDINKSLISFDLGDIVLTSRLVEDPYPNYEQFIPTENDKKMIISRDNLASAVKRLYQACKVEKTYILLTADINRLTISTLGVENEYKETIDCESNFQFEIAVNANYLIENLSVISDDSLLLEFFEYNTAIIISPYGKDKSKELYLLMPILKDKI